VSPELSPDGRWVAYIRGRGPNDLWVINTDGRRPTQIETGERYLMCPGTLRWTPDGKCILFECNDAIYGVGLDHLGPFPLTGALQMGGRWADHYDLHPDGKRIVYARKDGNIVIMPLDWSQAPAHLRPE